MKKVINVVIALFVCHPLYAGVWSSGGGALIKDRMNPWWIQNTVSIDYCIKHDPRHFSLDETSIDSEIKNAVAYWKNQFQHAFVVDFDRFDYRVIAGTQHFRKMPCTEDTDIVFQFGVMTEEQLARIDAQDYVSLAVRTEYDATNLRGKGFIYVAPDLGGPLRPNLDNFNEGVWSPPEGSMLKWVLVHELGHVFGIQHSAGWTNFRHGLGMMSAGAPQLVVTKGSEDIATRELPDYFKAIKPVTRSICTSTPMLGPEKEFWGLPYRPKCMKYDWDREKNTVEVFYAREMQNPSYIMAGVIKLEEDWEIIAEISQFWFPKGQRVVRPQPEGVYLENKFNYKSQYIVHERMDGKYESVDGTTKREVDVHIPLNKEGMNIEGVLNGKIERWL